jgi:hypothetical protein
MVRNRLNKQSFIPLNLVALPLCFGDKVLVCALICASA